MVDGLEKLWERRMPAENELNLGVVFSARIAKSIDSAIGVLKKRVNELEDSLNKLGKEVISSTRRIR